jgi:glycosyltransferase involved in cell wall biosynthesis
MKEEKLQNILLIMPYGSVGGMERLAETFYENYKKMGYNVKAVKIIGLDNDIISFGKDEIVLSKKDFSGYSPIQRMLFYATIPFLLRKIIKKYKIDISIAFGDMANCFSAITGTREKKVASFHAVKSIEFQNSAGISGFFKWSIHNTYKRLDKVVAISNAIKKDLIENCNYKFKNLQVIYNPHDASAIIQKSNEEFSSEENKYINKEFVLFLGRLSIQKAPWHLIKAFALIKDDFPDINLLMVGDGDSRVEKFTKDLVAHLKLNDRVLFAGRKNNPYKYLSKARCLALSSFYEGTPNVIAEAMILNIPVITTNCTNGISEMMVDKIREEKNNLLITDIGIITPDILNGKEGLIPDDFEINGDDERYAEGLKLILDKEMNDSIRNNDKSELLEKYNIEDVLIKYIS